MPLDEALARVVVDFAGRPFLVFEVPIDREMLLIHKDFPFALVEEFFKSFANKCACNIHVDLIRGRNGHHAAEAIFKAFAIALREAKAVVGSDIPSTKGVRLHESAAFAISHANVTTSSTRPSRTSPTSRARCAPPARSWRSRAIPTRSRRAQKLVLPGVGIVHRRDAMADGERASTPRSARRSNDGASLLGVCVGHQLLFDVSHEMGTTPGLGLVRGEVQQVRRRAPRPADRLEPRRRERGPLFEGVENGVFYFVNSYAAIERAGRDRARRLRRPVHRRGAARPRLRRAVSSREIVARPDCAC